MVALVANYYLNYRYLKLWGEIDPPKPKDDDELTLEEVLKINKADQYFDRWNEKYFKVARTIKRLVMFSSHKLFQLPFTHFYGFLHLTVRIQDHYMRWEWSAEDVLTYRRKLEQGSARVRADALAEIEASSFQYKGKLVERLDGDVKQKVDDDFEDDGAIDIDKDQLHEGGYEYYEGGALLAGEREGFDPFQYV